MSFFTSLSGLQAAQTDLSVISHNLANVSTNGFKKSRSEFADVIASSVSQNPTSQVGSGVTVKANRQQFSQGNIVQSGSTLDVAISGDGFFAVKPEPGSEVVNFTRNGSFQVDANRFIVDGQGGQLQGYPADASGGIIRTSLAGAVSLRLPAASGTPVATSLVAKSVNLPAGTAVPTAPAFDRFNPASFNNSTQTTIYDSEGNPQTLTNYFRRETVGAGAGSTSDWSVFSFVGDTQLTTSGNPSITATFDSNGVLTAPAGASAFDPFTPVGTATAQQFSFDISAGTTQNAGAFNVSATTQDGVPVGLLQGVAVDAEGLVKASFSNGDVQTLGQVILANFANPSGLRQIGNSNWQTTGLSGTPLLGEPNANGFGGLLSGAIERSNVDTTEELVNLISAQRTFQANARALDTANQVSQTIFNIQ